MQFGLPEEKRMLRDAVREFMERECPPRQVTEWEESATFPFDVWRKLAEYGYLGLPFPEEIGGGGGDFFDQMLICEQISYGFNSLAHYYSMCTLFGGTFLQKFGSPEQRQLTREVIAGRVRFALSMTEPNAGSDVASLTTRAERDGDGWVINGAKIFSTGAHMADYIILFARTDPNAPKHRGISCFLVPARTPGITPRPLRTMGGNAVQTCEVAYENVRLPADALIGELNRGWHMMLSLLDHERILTACQAVGLAERALDVTIEHARQREQFGQPIGKFQSIAHLLADAKTEIEAARLLTYQAACLANSGQPASMYASMAKLKATEVAKKVCLDGVQIHGGYGYTDEYEINRLARESIIGTIFGGSSQIQRNIIAKQMGL